MTRDEHTAITIVAAYIIYNTSSRSLAEADTQILV